MKYIKIKRLNFNNSKLQNNLLIKTVKLRKKSKLRSSQVTFQLKLSKVLHFPTNSDLKFKKLLLFAIAISSFSKLQRL